MSNPMKVRRLVTSDADLAAQTIRTLKWEAESTDVSSLDSAGLKSWLGNPSNVLISAITESGIGVGFALGYLLNRIDRSQPMLCFYEIVVASDHRRHGIGRQLVEAMKIVAQQSNALKMWVQTDPDNVAARTLYQRAGGIESATSDHVYSWLEGTFDNQEPSSS
jgi:ribosomal protein S18 acetylase RimI-like enzyme